MTTTNAANGIATKDVVDWTDLGKEMWSYLTGKGAAIDYTFVDMTVEVPRDTGPQAAHEAVHVGGDHAQVPALGGDPHGRAVDLDRQVGGHVEAGTVRAHPWSAFSVVVMRSVPLSFQVARGASGPVSRGTSTDMSTKV